RANDKYYQENYQKFTRQIKNILVANLKLLAPHKGEKLISYHQEFDYLVNRYKMSITDNIEEKPGVLPSPARIRYMIDYIRKNKIKVVLVSPWSNIAIARQIANESGAKLLVLPIQTGASDDTDSYLNMLKVTGKLLAEALKK
ncbi:MAG: zinc ABC transporter substrate-binding protein, partial [Leptospiraceae bacterium]|nr:zinc ABC transporter substrate-binding protein [Leptospiraceae bacterium]